MRKVIVKTFKNLGKKIGKHSNLILTVCTLVGIGETVYLTAKASPRAKEVLESAEKEKGEELTLVEKVKTAAPVYAPVAASVVVTSGLVIVNHRIASKKIKNAVAATMAARKAYNGLYKEFSEFRKDTKEVVGDEVYSNIITTHEQKKLDKVPDEVKENAVENAPGTRGKGSLLCWIPYQVCCVDTDSTGDFFWATPEELDAAEGNFNKHFQEYGWSNIDTYRGYFDLPFESDDIEDAGYNKRCECFSGHRGDRENEWIHINRIKGKIGEVDCWIIDFDRDGLCTEYACACCGEEWDIHELNPSGKPYHNTGIAVGEGLPFL